LNTECFIRGFEKNLEINHLYGNYGIHRQVQPKRVIYGK